MPLSRPDPSDPRRDPYEGLRSLGQRGRGPSRPAAASSPPRSGRGLGGGTGSGGPGGRGPGDGREVGGRGPRRPLIGRRRWPRKMLVGINIIVALCLVGAVGSYAYVRYQLSKVNRVPVAGLHAASGPMTILIVGSDTRDLKGPGNAEYGSQTETPGQRSDTIMLARVVPKADKITLMSIPRDLWVNIKGIGQSRINAAFNNGPNLLVSTIESQLHIPINHFVEINFDTFKAITDAVGGVKFYFPTPARDLYSNLYVPKAGCVNLTGNQALGFARSRHYEYQVNGQWVTQGLSDLARIQRQQSFVKKMLAKAETKFTDPLALNRIVSGITKNLTVDKGFSSSTMLNLAETFRHANVAGIPTETLPTNNAVIGGADVLTLQDGPARQMIHAFNTLGTAKAHPAAHRTAAHHATTHHTGAASRAKTAASTTTTTYLLPGPTPTKTDLARC